MYFLYVDESGKSGLHDPAQPFHVLGGLAVSDKGWLEMERDLNDRIDALVPRPRPYYWELHMTEMWNGKGIFKPMPRATRRALWEAVLDVIDAHAPTLIFVAVNKPKLVAKYVHPDPPEDLTYRYMVERFDSFLRRRDDVGMIVSDEQKGSEDVIRRAHSRYRSTGTGWQQIANVIETPFFAPSHWSRMLQIVDVATWFVNRDLRERATGNQPRPEMFRLEKHLDGFPRNRGYGMKMVP